MGIVRSNPPPEPEPEPTLEDFGLYAKPDVPPRPAPDAFERLGVRPFWERPLSEQDAAMVEGTKSSIRFELAQTGLNPERVLIALRFLAPRSGDRPLFIDREDRLVLRALRELIDEAVAHRQRVDARLAVHDAVVIVEWVEERSPGKSVVRSAAFESDEDAEAFTRRLGAIDASFTRHVAQFQVKGGPDIRL
jgi:hypothetical protein